MKVLGLCSYPTEAAATRFRLEQYVGELEPYGIELDIRSFLDAEQFAKFYASGNSAGKAFSLLRSVSKRILLSFTVRNYDLIIVQREAVMFGPAVFEWFYQRFGRVPMVLDLDDATYVSYVSPRFGRLGSKLKFFGKTDRLIDRSCLVICGNRFIADYVNDRGKQAIVIPTVVNGDVFCPLEHKNDAPVIGWVGTHSTYQFLERLFPVFQRLASRHTFVIRVIGSGKREIDLPGVEVQVLDWDLGREISDFQALDIGVYPIFPGGSANSAWIQGKSGFKAIQYMAVGVPFVMSPIGVCAEMGEPGETHLNAESEDDWYNALDELLSNSERRSKMGLAGRRYFDQSYNLAEQAKKLAAGMQSVVNE